MAMDRDMLELLATHVERVTNSAPASVMIDYQTGRLVLPGETVETLLALTSRVPRP